MVDVHFYLHDGHRIVDVVDPSVVSAETSWGDLCDGLLDRSYSGK
jgi:hypothetical protein